MVITSATASLLLAACSLDWAVREDPGNVPMPEAGLDVADVVVADEAAEDSSADGSEPVEAGECAALASEVERTRKKARECQLSATPPQCKSTVTDECDCQVVVRDAASAASAEFTTAVAAFVAACGKTACKACPQLVGQGSWMCLANAGGVDCFP